MTTSDVEGGCLCNAIRYRIAGMLEAFPPAREIWLEDKLDGETLNDSLPHFRRSSSEGPGDDT